VLSFMRILAASICMGMVCYFISRNKIIANKYIQLGFVITAGFVSYIVFCFMFRVSEMQQLWVWLVHRKST
jgi:hypothetical protein